MLTTNKNNVHIYRALKEEAKREAERKAQVFTFYSNNIF